MEYSISTHKIFDYVTKAGKLRKTRKSSTPSQIIPLDEQTKNNFELWHDTKLKNTMIYLDPDYIFRLSPTLLIFAVENRIYIRKSKYNPGSTETDQIIEHELTHVQQYSEGRANESVWGALQGEYNENPTGMEILIYMGLNFIPFVGQACDVRDITACLKKLVIEKRVDDIMILVTLLLPAIGCIPCNC